jgi:hypothetical protein
MAQPAERMRMMRARRRRRGLRELRLVVPDARSEAVRNRIATQVASLNPIANATHFSGSSRYPNSMPTRRGDLVIVAAPGITGSHDRLSSCSQMPPQRVMPRS